MKTEIYKQSTGSFQVFQGNYSLLSDFDLIREIFPDELGADNEDELLSRILNAAQTRGSEKQRHLLEELGRLPKNTLHKLECILQWFSRLHSPEGPVIRTPLDVFETLKTRVPAQQEAFYTLSLNGAHQLIRARMISLGIANKTLVHPREVLAPLLEDRAVSFIIAHNHPSGNPQPSQEDKEVTRRIKSLGDSMGIPLLDHVILGDQEYYSFVGCGLF